jgi:hypothetical protein
MKKIIVAILAVLVMGTAALAAETDFLPQQPGQWYFWSYLPGYPVHGELYADAQSCGAAMWTFASLVNPVQRLTPAGKVIVAHTEAETLRNLDYMTCMPQSRQPSPFIPFAIEGHETGINSQGNLVFQSSP